MLPMSNVQLFVLMELPLNSSLHTNCQAPWATSRSNIKAPTATQVPNINLEDKKAFNSDDLQSIILTFSVAKAGANCVMRRRWVILPSWFAGFSLWRWNQLTQMQSQQVRKVLGILIKIKIPASVGEPARKHVH